ncbi:MAG: CPBP family intramembrane metalloprotease [Acidobacteriota bacterium]|nr:CPBP family intramembrane metalloprotease [Acidobacteriota bacterium]
MSPTTTNEKLGVALRVGFFVLLVILGITIFPILINFLAGPGAYLLTAALSTFAAAAVANAIPLRIYERGQLSDIGLGWSAASRRNLALGMIGGIGSALVVLIGPILVRAAELEPVQDSQTQWGSLMLVTVVLLFGAVGEEMLFRGYGFQILMNALGPYATILPVSVLFGLAHTQNQNVGALGILNTILWGVLLGYAFLRSGDLWLPIGLHFGWNWTLPLLGQNLSGFTMGVTGYAMHWKTGVLWSGGAYGPEGSLLTTAAVGALVYYLHRAPIAVQQPFLLKDVDAFSNSTEISNTEA